MPAGVVKFGDGMELDSIAYELRRSGRPLKLERIPMETLLLLVERRGQLVVREEIIEKIWGKGVFLDTDNSINSAIRKIRQALKDDPENPVYIQTVTGRGYRFIATVIETEAARVPVKPGTAKDLPEVKATELAPVPLPVRPLLRARWMVVGAALAAVVAGGIYLLRAGFRATAPAPPRVMLVVLPFSNLSNDTSQEYFSDGLTEETITDLGELNAEQLGVIARTSSTAYKHTSKTITQIGQELGVDYVLEGSVRGEGGKVRISAQLIRVKDQAHLWAHTYDREAGELLALENELGRAIAQQVQVKLSPYSGSRSSVRYAPNPQAYELYLKGRFNLNKRTWPEIDESTRFFQQAIAKDPGFALAYAALAASYLANAIGAPQEFDPKAKAAALRALELDGDLAEAHTVLGAVKADFEYDWDGSEKEFKRAIELNPNDADAHCRYAWSYLVPRGESDEAIAEIQKALKLDPFSRIDNTLMGLAFFYARRYGESAEQFAKATRLNPDFFVTYYHLSWLDAQIGQYGDAITVLTKGRLLAGDSRMKNAAANETALRKAVAAQAATGFWQQIEKQQSVGPEVGEFAMPQVYARLGNKEKALQGLERNYEQREPLGTLVNVDPAFDTLRSDPRFADLVLRMGLHPSATSH